MVKNQILSDFRFDKITVPYIPIVSIYKYLKHFDLIKHTNKNIEIALVVIMINN
jgi:hypothetical protein